MPGMNRKRVEGNCPKCGTYRWKLQADHIIPKFMGGSNDNSNIQHICANCHEDKTRAELSKLLSGRKFTKAHKRKISLSNMGKNKGKPSPRRGVKLSPETIELIRKAQTGKPWSAKRRAAQNRKHNK